MADYGIRISQPGHDAISDSDDTHMMVTSKFNNVKVATIVDTVCVANLGNYTFSGGTHGLGYVPMALGFYYDQSVILSGTYAPAALSDPAVGISIMDTTANVARVYPPFATGGSVFGKVVVFIEQAA